MANGLYVVAVRIAHEGGEVARVVFGPQARLVKYLSPGGNRGIEEREHRRSIGCGERDVGFAEALPGGLAANPELGFGWRPIADCRSEVHDPLASQRGQHFVVEAGAGTDIGALDREVVEHAVIIVHRARRRHRKFGKHRLSEPSRRAQWRSGQIRLWLEAGARDRRSDPGTAAGG